MKSLKTHKPVNQAERNNVRWTRLLSQAQENPGGRTIRRRCNPTALPSTAVLCRHVWKVSTLSQHPPSLPLTPMSHRGLSWLLVSEWEVRLFSGYVCKSLSNPRPKRKAVVVSSGDEKTCCIFWHDRMLLILMMMDAMCYLTVAFLFWNLFTRCT